MTPSIYQRIGGGQAIEAVVVDFYDRILDDRHLSGFFTGANVSRLKGRQTEFFCAALGGPEPYTGASLPDVHRGRAITQAHFDRVATHLGAALTAAGVSPAVIDEVLTTVAPLADDIVSSRPEN
ncbi:group I truncated hemoglobin [Antrihabitans cavernicola]|uniref:Group 1 truncated hemoglobin n=1 Tax=Antrihabitans cavernicola TaxID=2495913 RepID=A0A5A7S5L8_9NOCA|nr:group 1 truncated hemoglobin [Spelaeibacter cavernicola]KAA0017016.1 group 1 truncated hemoglobin [Spelaeibacter cavernicola]